MPELNPDEYVGEEEKFFKIGGGGGGGKKKEHHGKKTQTAVSVELRENREKNQEEYEEMHPESSETENTEILAVMERLVKLDETVTGLPRLEGYAKWVLRVLTDDEFRKTRDLSKEVEVDFYKRSKGAGGQNVNKVETAVSMEHLPTGLSLRRSKQRAQVANREEAYMALEALVEEHIDKWMDMVTGGDLPTINVLRETFAKAESFVANDEKNESKMRTIERILGVTLRDR